MSFITYSKTIKVFSPEIKDAFGGRGMTHVGFNVI
jgi:hypothetical protein